MTTTTKAAHTPGPWHIGKESVWQGNIYGPGENGGTQGGTIIAAIPHSYINADANRLVIAAAPDMFAALEAIVSASRVYLPPDLAHAIRIQGEAAIQKARGGQ